MKWLEEGRRCISDFRAREDGTGTAFGLLLFISLAALGGIAVDVSSVTTARTNLQTTADSVAHSALVARERMSATDAKATALALSAANLQIEQVGQVINEDDIMFGVWDPETRIFTPDPASRTAVHVTARQNSENDNPLGTFLLRIVGFDKWDVAVVSIFDTYRPHCLREGFVAEGYVDLQSGNNFSDGFCIHSNEYVSLNSGNSFAPKSSVSMPDLASLQLPTSGLDSNPGLADALSEGAWNIRILSRLAEVIEGISNPDSSFRPAYLSKTTGSVKLNKRTIEQSHLVPGRVHTFDCKGGAALTFANGVLVENVAIITDCDVKFNEGVVLSNAVVATTSTGSKSITSAAGMQLGRNDNCAPGGEAQLVTMGSMSFPSGLKIYGSQLLAAGNIDFSANGDGVEGASIIAGGTISGTSNMTMGFCDNKENSNLQVDYFRLVE